MYLILFKLLTVTGFNIQYKLIPNRLIRFNNDKLRNIDNKLNTEKQKIKKLLIQKNNILKNMTGLNLHNEKYIKNYLENMENDNDDDDDDDDEYEPKQKPNKINYNIIINTNQNQNKDNVKSENFELVKNSTYNFNDIGGYELIKDELMQCADMLVNYTKYAKYNVRVPKGIILEGPPGNGKTLIAKCFSGEINIGFIPVSGAQFQEKYVGVGASRVRELFELAKENVPCIIFIDELDALGRKRSSDSTSNTEHDSTLNELLVNLDGFKSVNGIFIIGATNRIDLLDSALIRPGRIDKKIYIGNPDRKTREHIINIHIKNKPIEPTITIDYLIEITNGFSGAEIENFFNEAMLYVLRQNRHLINKQDLSLIANRILVGFQSVKNQLSDEILFQVAVHEIGHALIGLLTKQRKLLKITINLYSPKSLGFTLFEPSSNHIQTKEQLINEMMILLGGRIAEEIIFKNNNISSGASHDLQQVKKIAEQMIVNLGMGDKIIISDQNQINAEIDNIISIAYSRTKIILSNAELLIKDCAKLLMINHELSPNMITNLIINKYPYIKLDL
jgi:cell division protease FtsH